MIYQEIIVARCNTSIGPCSKRALRRARLYDWPPVIRFFLSIVWRRWDEKCSPIDAGTAWKVSEGLMGIVRDPAKWKEENEICAIKSPLLLAEIKGLTP